MGFTSALARTLWLGFTHFMARFFRMVFIRCVARILGVGFTDLMARTG